MGNKLLMQPLAKTYKEYPYIKGYFESLTIEIPDLLGKKSFYDICHLN